MSANASCTIFRHHHLGRVARAWQWTAARPRPLRIFKRSWPVSISAGAAPQVKRRAADCQVIGRAY